MDSDDQNHSNQCTESRCIAGDNEKKIVCSKCKSCTFRLHETSDVSSCSTPKIIVDAFVAIVLKCQMNFNYCSTNEKRDFSKSASEKLKGART